MVQERQVLYLRPNIFVVLDRMIPTKRGAKKPHTYQARWHVDTLKMIPAMKDYPAYVSIQESTTLAKERGNVTSKRNRIIVAPLFVDGVKVEQINGKTDGKWNELGGIYAIHPYRKTTTITHTRAPAKGEQRFLTMFITLDRKEPSPLKSIVQKGTSGAVVEFTDGRKLEFVIEKGVLRLK